jgi:3-dehydroquinate synthase
MKFEIQTTRLHATHVSIGNEIWIEQLSKLSSNHSSCVILIDERVHELYQPDLETATRAFNRIKVLTIPSGEQSKSVQQYSKLVDEALHWGVKRNTLLVAIGGGVTGDLAGFVASTLLRGLPLVHIPTTVLAMVDSSIGGKTGVNHQSGKNLIGAFYQPSAIIIDLTFLQTLPDKEWNCGFGEILKYGCISDPGIFELLAPNRSWRQIDHLDELLAACAHIKADIVTKDELETGERAFLNYGHTFAHALEQVTEYKRFAHGEAVFVGLIAATWLSAKLGAPVNPDLLLAYKEVFKLATQDLMGELPRLIDTMYRDKKVMGSELTLVLLNDYGNPITTEFSDVTLLRDAWAFALNNSHSE